MISGYLVIKLGKTFEKGISWSCVVFGIGILINYLLSATYRGNFELFSMSLGTGVLDVTHGLIGAGIIRFKKIRSYLRIVVGDFIEYWALSGIAVGIFKSDGITVAVSMGLFAQAWGIVIGGKWIYFGGIIWGIGLLPLGINSFSTEIGTLITSIALICICIFMFYRQNLFERAYEEEVKKAYEKYVEELNRKERRRAERRSRKKSRPQN